MPAVSTRGRTYGRATNEPKPRSDAYTGLLLLSLLAQIAGVIFLFIDWHSYPSAEPPKAAPLSATFTPGGGTPATQPTPAAPGGVPPGANPAPPAPGGNPMPPAGAPMPPR